MKIASVVIKNSLDIDENIGMMISRAGEARSNGADMVLFSEGEISGRTYGNDSAADLKLAMEINDPRLGRISDFAMESGIIIGFGLLEASNGKLYNSYIMFDKEGKAKVHYRMINEDWHGKSENYDSGQSIKCWVIDDLAFSVLAGNDCLDEINQSMVSALDVDICFIPRARGFGDLKTGSLMDHHLLPYIEAVRNMNTNILMINQYLEKDGEVLYYGGVTEINSSSEIENSLEIRREGILYTEI